MSKFLVSIQVHSSILFRQDRGLFLKPKPYGISGIFFRRFRTKTGWAFELCQQIWWLGRSRAPVDEASRGLLL